MTKEEKAVYTKQYRIKNKEIIKRKKAIYNAKNKEKRSVSYKKWALKNKEKLLINHKKWRENNPQKYFAKEVIHNLLSRNKINRKHCQICGKKKTDFHHVNYNRPLLVYELCRKHHLLAHKDPNVLTNIGPFNFYYINKTVKYHRQWLIDIQKYPP